MRKTDVVIIGGGQAGLVMSRSLARTASIISCWSAAGSASAGIPSAGTRCTCSRRMPQRTARPAAHGSDPDAFMPARAFAAYLDTYAQAIAAPVISGAEVTEVERRARLPRRDNAGHWQARAVVVATGHATRPFGRRWRRRSRPHPSDVPGGLSRARAAAGGWRSGGRRFVDRRSTRRGNHASGRPVTCGRRPHTRAAPLSRPRHLRLDGAAGILDDPALEGGNLDAARRQPSLQLVGRSDTAISISNSARSGHPVIGRLAAIGGTKAAFAATSSALRRLPIRACCGPWSGSTTASAPKDLPHRPPIPRRASPFSPQATRSPSISQRGHPLGRLGHRLYPPLSWLKAPVLDAAARSSIAAV